MESENDPCRTEAPLLWLGGCNSANLWSINAIVGDTSASHLDSLLQSEPPLVDVDHLPKHIDRYLKLLSEDGTTPVCRMGLTYELPSCLAVESDVQLVASDSEDGLRLEAALTLHGMPDQLMQLGFLDVSDLWRPWCAVVVGDEVASLAFAARLSNDGADIGVVTVPEFRGRGYAAAVTAGWTRLTALGSRRLFYSTDKTNLSSQRVASRLGLRLIGATCSLHTG